LSQLGIRNYDHVADGSDQMFHKLAEVTMVTTRCTPGMLLLHWARPR
jgi:hypothetical protein